jgi:hypothetical protein
MDISSNQHIMRPHHHTPAAANVHLHAAQCTNATQPTYVSVDAPCVDTHTSIPLHSAPPPPLLLPSRRWASLIATNAIIRIVPGLPITYMQQKFAPIMGVSALAAAVTGCGWDQGVGATFGGGGRTVVEEGGTGSH